LNTSILPDDVKGLTDPFEELDVSGVVATPINWCPAIIPVKDCGGFPGEELPPCAGRQVTVAVPCPEAMTGAFPVEDPDALAEQPANSAQMLTAMITSTKLRRTAPSMADQPKVCWDSTIGCWGRDGAGWAPIRQRSGAPLLANGCSYRPQP
jgi:hypothetical protein